jgi:hypothetical protein
VFNFRRVDLLMRQWDVKQGRLEAALFKLRQTGKRPLANERGCMGGPKVREIQLEVGQYATGCLLVAVSSCLTQAAP